MKPATSMRDLKAAVKPYNLLAKYYDQLFTSHYPWTAAAHKALLAPVLAQVTSACDLACGTGTTALELARRGIRVCAVDLSNRMCSLTRRKARAAKVPLRVLQGDMRSFQLPEPVDLVL